MPKQILLSQTYSYAKPSILLMVLLLCGVSVFLAVTGARQIIAGQSFTGPGVIIPFIMFLVFGGFGVRMLMKYFLADKNDLIISNEGVEYGRHQWSWEKINFMHARRMPGSRYYLVATTKGFWGIDNNLMTDEGLSEAQLTELMQKLSEYVDVR